MFVFIFVNGKMASFLEIVGLESDTNGRSCTVHETCGESVEVGDALRLVECVISHNGVNKIAVKCVKVMDGQDTCTVAFLPRALASLPKVQQHLNKFVQVSELYNDSKNMYKRAKSQANHGMALVEMPLEDVGRTEQCNVTSLPLKQSSIISLVV